MTVFVPGRYDERISRLALGIEPQDANSGHRMGADVDIRLESYPRPVDRWRVWPPGATLTEALPRLDHHHSGRFAQRYDQGVTLRPVCRIVADDVRGRVRTSGASRVIVPRRLRFTIADEAAVIAGDVVGPPTPPWMRLFPIGCFPGATAPITSRATVLRGRIRRDVGGELVPVRWARVRATDALGDDLGWAHGDDRGEFVVVIGPHNDVGLPSDPQPVFLTVGRQDPHPQPDPLDPQLAMIDPLWDLPVEEVTASDIPETEPSMNGRSFAPTPLVAAPIVPAQPVNLPLGRETAIEILIA